MDDVLRTLDTQLRSLKQQVRQASRYRNLAEHIRRTEAALLHLRWLEAEDDAKRTREALQEASSRVNELLAVVTRGNAERADKAAELPDLRAQETACAAAVQKLTLAREQLDAEARRAQEEIEATQRRILQTQDDLSREQGRLKDGREALARLEAEGEDLNAKTLDIEDRLPELNRALSGVATEVAELEETLAALMKQAAEGQARKESLDREVQNLMSRQAAYTQRRAELDTQRTALASEIATRPDLSLARAMVEACEIELDRRKRQTEEAEQARTQAEETLARARADDRAAEEKLTRLRAEAETIAAILAHHDETPFDQVIDLITVTPGLENALAVALGEALTASLDPRAAMHWRETAPLSAPPALPEGAAPLADFVQAPPALARSLSQIGLVENLAKGEEAAAALQPGQILVSRDGWAWRWDGFTLTPEAQTASVLRLQQRNRLAALKEDILSAETEKAGTEAALLESSSLHGECQVLESQTRAALQAAFAALADAQSHLARQERDAAAASAKLSSLEASAAQVAQEMNDLRSRAVAVEEERASLPDLETLRAAIAEKGAALAQTRSRQAAQQSACDLLLREKEMCEARKAVIAQETAAWRERMAGAEEQAGALAARVDAWQTELESLRAKPAEIEETRSRLLTELSEAEQKRSEAADALIAAEQKLSVVEHQLKHDEAALARAREDRVRAEAAVASSEEHFAVLRERMAEKLDCAPENLSDIAAFGEGENLPSVFELEQLLARYVRERDNMGPVNLRAEMESEAAQSEIDKLTREKDDLIAAIGKLRQGIGQLNREARERLNNAFAQVNDRFQKLFTELFGGGKAYLELIDNEDPMNAGLEIVAAPPGKKQQILSLLSGGERTLTALALLFAVFQTNPSPICVLDEAEAALDESNIGRFCALVSRIARETDTRFLIITHQRVTMAHMDRLFGVTMGEKGVSKLVSVDLASAVALRDGRKTSAVEEALEAVQAA